MSQFLPALQFTLGFEDPKGNFEAEPDACPEGYTGAPCSSVAGINSGVFPLDYEAVMSMPQPSRHHAVESFYLERFWSPMKLVALASQELVNRVFDQGVNGGAINAVMLLQQAANGFGFDLIVDGAIGPVTRNAVNELDVDRILGAYRQRRLKHYEDIASAHPADAQYLAGWKRRALA